ncbi:MAG: DUF721 domain-containing protein [Candidatus Gracilibacteria bacterium]|jgi:hypothetical protein
MFENFQKFIPKAAIRFGVKKEIEAAEICHIFKKLVPEIFSTKPEPEKYIEPAYYKNSVLVINTQSPAWSQEVIMRKEQIIDEINTKAGKKIIANIRAELKR